MFKAHRLPDEDPKASQVKVAYCMPGPADDFTIRYIDQAALQHPSYWLSSPVSKTLGCALRICIADVNDILQPAGSVQECDEPLCHVANRFLTICDVWSEDFGTIYGFGALRGTALVVCENGGVPHLGFLECMNAYVKKQLVLVGNEVENLRTRGDEGELWRFRESVKDVFGEGAVRKEWEEWKRKEAEANAKFEANRVAAEREAREAGEAGEDAEQD